ncbi:MAG: sensor histidine kinase, partial [Pontibacterium sp.]
QLNCTRTLTVAMKLNGSYVVLEVGDTGQGIADDIREHLFDPFVTSKSIGNGLGLGLAIVKSIVNDLDGDISVASEQGVGTTFTLSFPLCTDKG